MSERPRTPPRTTSTSGGADAAARVPLTPEQLKRIEINRLRAKARQKARQAEQTTSSSSNTLNAKGKRPLEVVPDSSHSPTAPGRPSGSSSVAISNGRYADSVSGSGSNVASSSKRPNAAQLDGTGQPKLKRDSKLMGRYLDYDLSKMVDSRGGFLIEEGTAGDEDEKRRLRERERERMKQNLDQPIFLDPQRNPRCQECNSIDVDPVYKNIFGCLVCKKCRDEKPERYSLLTKTECKEDYLLTDPELRDEELLPHLLKANPHKATWNNMMLFLRFQVEEFAWKKWGSPEELDKEWERRVEEKRKKKSKKFEEGLKELRKKTREGAYQRRKDQEHQHEYGEPEKLDDGSGTSIQRCKECGFELEVEIF